MALQARLSALWARQAARRAVARLEREGACGMIFKSRSPSCGIGDAQLHDGASETTDGLMVRAVRAALPPIPAGDVLFPVDGVARTRE